MITCTHITEEKCVFRVPKAMFGKKAEIIEFNAFAGGNRNHNREGKSHSPLFCVECDLSNSSFLCLECGSIFCGRYDAGHAIEHYNETKHAVVMDCLSYGLHCYECDEEVQLEFEKSLHSLIKSIQLLFEIDDLEEDVVEKTTELNDSGDNKSPPNKANKNNQNEKPKTFKKMKSGRVAPMSSQFQNMLSHGRPRGLKNVGNTCYMNSIFQAFLCIEPFFTYMNTLPPLEDYMTTESADYLLPLSDETRLFFNELSNRKRTETFTTNQIRKSFVQRCPRFNNFEQHDAHEFMRFFLDQIHVEMKKCRNLPDIPEGSTIVQHVFGGTLQSKIICLKCEHESNKDESMLDLSLDLVKKSGRYKIADSLNAFFAREVLDKGEKYDCSKCKSKQNSSKQWFIKQLPEVLCLHLKRFREDGDKMNCVVEFPIDHLSLDHFMAEEVVEPPKFYELTAVTVHVGGEENKIARLVDQLLKFHTTIIPNSLIISKLLHQFISHINSSCSYGHYMTYGKLSDGWFNFDDCSIRTVDKITISKQQAYILFYSRKSDSAPASTPSSSNAVNVAEMPDTKPKKQKKQKKPVK